MAEDFNRTFLGQHSTVIDTSTLLGEDKKSSYYCLATQEPKGYQFGGYGFQIGSANWDYTDFPNWEEAL